MGKQKIKSAAEKETKRKKRERILKLLLLAIVLFVINLYIILSILYKGESFTVSLDSELRKRKQFNHI